MTSTTRKSTLSFSRAALGGLALLTMAATSASANECNPITFLFGGCHQEAARPMQAPISIEPITLRPGARATAIHHAAAPRPRQAAAPVVASRSAPAHTIAPVRATMRQTALSAMKQAPAGSIAQFAADPTLRAGDVVVTSEGFRVYRDHRFSPIAEGGSLAALERASMRAPTTDYASPIATAPVSGHGFVALRQATRIALNQ